MERSYLCLPFEYGDEMEELTDEEFGRLVRNLLKYSMTGEIISPVGNERFYWKRALRTEDTFHNSFEAKERKRSESGRKAANARWKKDADACERMRTHDDALNRNAENAPIVLDIINNNKDSNNKEAKLEVISNTKKEIKKKESAFDSFWKAYPKKVGKGAARKAFDKIKGVPVETMISAIERQKESRQWTTDGGQYIPNPATWLNQERWEDTLEAETEDSWNPFVQIAKEEAARSGQIADGRNPFDFASGIPKLLP